jgi:hypothetical protein
MPPMHIGSRGNSSLRQHLLPVLLLLSGCLAGLYGYLTLQEPTGTLILGGAQNLGSVSAGCKVNLRATVFNLHPYPVEVDAEPTCGCTVLDIKPSRLPPFGAAYLQAQIDTAGFPSGHQSKVLLLHFFHEDASWTKAILVHFRIINKQIVHRRS